MIKIQSYTLCNQFFFQKCVSRNKEINEYYANAEFTRCRVYQVPSLPGAEFTGCRVHYSRCRVHQVPGLPGAGFTSIRDYKHWQRGSICVSLMIRSQKTIAFQTPEDSLR